MHGDSWLAIEHGVTVDVAELRRRVAALRGPGTPAVERAELLDLLSAGELLPGWYDEWVLGERERLRQAQLHTVELLCDLWCSEGNRAAALDAALLAVRLDPLRESAHRRVVAVHLDEGNVAEALRQSSATSGCWTTSCASPRPSRCASWSPRSSMRPR